MSLDQFLVFVTVVETGSFSAAARALNRAQSVVTYTVQKLEEQIGTDLFDRTGYRPKMSEAGRTLLPQVRRVLEDVGRLRGQARELTRGIEAELRLSVGGLIPFDILAPALRDFSVAYPTVRLRITVERFSMDIRNAAAWLAKDTADIRIMVGLFMPEFLVKRVIGAFSLIDVAAPRHPLAGVAGPLSAETLRDHLQIVLTEGPETVANDRGVAALNTWRVTDLNAKHSLLLAGAGWGSLPDVLVAADLAAGRLVRLPSQEWIGNEALRRLSMVAAYRIDEPLGPAGRWMLDRLEHEAR